MTAPRATYRLQLSPSFTFRQAEQLTAYLQALGISHLYLSPLLKPRRGSSHGYDVVDHTALNPELGSEEELQGLLAGLSRMDMGLVLDIVPNHMAFAGENRMLVDVLENGPDSRYFEFFDIEWSHPVESIRGRLLAPFLGAFYGICLEKGEIRLGYDEEGLYIRYYDLRLPLRLDSYQRVLAFRQAELALALGKESPDYVKFLGLLYALRHLPPGSQARERYDQISFAKHLLWELYGASAEIRSFIDENIRIFNGSPGVPESFDALDALLSEQYFRLSFWKVGTEELNYRRFFNLNELITLRMEEKAVFEHTHSLIFSLGRKVKELGLRIDHVDGLYDPLQYLRRLRERSLDSYLVVEKILALNEELPSSWPVDGTTGYEFLNVANGLFCNRRNRLRLDKIYRRFSGQLLPFPRLLQEKKRLIAEKHMVGDVDNLAGLLKHLAARHRYGSDFTLYGFKKALAELLAQFPVYRSYISPEESSEQDRRFVEEAVRRAKEALPDFVHELDFIQKIFELRFEEDLGPQERQQWYHFIQRFQQFSGPLMAKGMEDTSLYVYNRLLSLNEVGGNPDKLGVSNIEFHHFNRKHASSRPLGMNATSSHDSKRGEDVRARINVLSEIPLEWERQAGSWSRLNRKHKIMSGKEEFPDRNDEYFLYQTLLGAYPFSERERPQFLQRMKAYLIKAVREAKVHTAWLAPDSVYEEAFLAFFTALFADGGDNPFLEQFLPFQRRIAWFGALNSLSQILLKMTCPGLPDFYQGSELWDLNLVDPDNRRPVDFAARSDLLQRIQRREASGVPALARELFSRYQDGGVKLFLIYRTLQARRRDPRLFARGSYTPVGIQGRWKNNLVAFTRRYGGRTALVCAPRFCTELVETGELPLGEKVWADTLLTAPSGIRRWENAITAEALEGRGNLPAARLLSCFPAALLLGGAQTSPEV